MCTRGASATPSGVVKNVVLRDITRTTVQKSGRSARGGQQRAPRARPRDNCECWGLRLLTVAAASPLWRRCRCVPLEAGRRPSSQAAPLRVARGATICAAKWLLDQPRRLTLPCDLDGARGGRCMGHQSVASRMHGAEHPSQGGAGRRGRQMSHGRRRARGGEPAAETRSASGPSGQSVIVGGCELLRSDFHCSRFCPRFRWHR